MNIELFLTTDCNMGCVFCGAWNQEDHNKHISYEKVCNILDTLSESGYKYLNLTGGEPFLHKHIFDFVDYAHERGFYINIPTNALFINEKAVNRLKFKNVNIRVSFHSLDRDRFKKITLTDTMEKVISAIKFMRDNQIPFSIGSTIYEENIDEIENLADFALENRAKFIRFQAVFSVYRGRDIKLESEFYEDLLTRIVSVGIKHRKNLDFKKKNNIFLHDYIDIMTTKRCGAASSMYMAIDPNLVLVPCPVLPHYIDLPTGTYESMDSIEKMKQDYNALFSDEMVDNLEGICRDCEYKSVCKGGCLSTKLARGMKITVEQPVCMKNIVRNVINKFDQKEAEEMIQYWQYHNDKRANKENVSCIRRIPVWELNYKYN
ncbi:radical SAM protein [Effusibacillus consociatus]|uniref:Radical SAM protein n=1 Tax=Effusibacillus consociatus TaxID=1117041 RepID=A0ABV9PX79_9BACL